MSKIVSGFLASTFLTAVMAAAAPKDELKEAQDVVTKLHKCLREGGSNESMVRACGVDRIKSELGEEEQKRLWLWLQLNRQVKQLAACPNESLRFLDEEKLRDIKVVACSDYKVRKVPRRALFFFSEQGGLRLADIKIHEPDQLARPVAEKPEW